MIRRLIRISAIAAIVLGGAYACAYEVLGFRHTETLLTEAVSPDGDWKAVVYEELYEGLYMTYMGAEVHLISMHDPHQSTDILGVSATGADEDPDIAWTAPRTLQVTAHSSLDANVLTCEFEGVRIEIRFPPDEAERRAAWHRQERQPDPGANVASTSPCP